MHHRLLGIQLPHDTPLEAGLDLSAHIGAAVSIVTLSDPNMLRVGYLDLLKNSEEWALRVCGKVSSTEWRRGACTQRIIHELSMASHYGLPGVIVPLPIESTTDDFLSLREVAEVFLLHCLGNGRTKIVVDVQQGNASQWSLYRKLLCALNIDSFSPLDSTSVTHWSDFAAVRERRAAHSMLNVMLTLAPHTPIDDRWLGERVSGFVLPSTATGMVWHSGSVLKLLKARCSVMVDLSDVPPENLGSVEVLDRIGYEMGQLNALYSASKDPIMDAFIPYEDALQSPLQPLGDHLPNPTYGVFEADEVKYTCYQMAVEAFLLEWNASAKKDDFIHLVVLGAGRGPLVTSVLKASSVVGNVLPLRITIIEKNPHAVGIIKVRLLEDALWLEATASGAVSMVVVEGDGRHVGAQLGLPTSAFGPVHLVISELLGSFGDNELSPECIEGFMDSYINACGESGDSQVARPVCIPREYTSFAAPIYSSTLLDRVRDICLKGGSVAHDDPMAAFHTMYVVQPRRYCLLSQSQMAFNFSHKDPETFTKEATLRFTTDQTGILHGFLGYFECVLYNEDTNRCEEDALGQVLTAPHHCLLSTNPPTHTDGMASWFPLFIPLLPAKGASLEVAKGDEICLKLSRLHDSTGVWYEWEAFVNGTPVSSKMNTKGQFSKIRL